MYCCFNTVMHQKIFKQLGLFGPKILYSFVTDLANLHPHIWMEPGPDLDKEILTVVILINDFIETII